MTSPKFDHVGILVDSFGAVADFMATWIGLDIVVPHREEALGLDILWVDVDGVGLEFICPFDPDTKAAELLRQGRGGVHHVAFQVHELDGMLQDLGRAGVRLNDAAPRPGVHGSRIAFVDPTSTDGVLIELVEHLVPNTRELHG